MDTARRTLALQAAACFATLWFAGPSSLAAQDAYPSRAITIVVPYTAGGGVDTLARILAEDMGASLGQSVIVENVPGASGTIGANRVARAEPDGHTLLLSAAGEIAVHPHLRKLPYDPQEDLAPSVSWRWCQTFSRSAATGRSSRWTSSSPQPRPSPER